MSQTHESSPMQDLNPAAQKHTAPAAPRWVAVIGALLLGIIFALLPNYVTIGPSWLALVLEVILLLPLALEILFKRSLPHKVRRGLLFALLGVVTLALIIGVVLLIVTLQNRTEKDANSLLRTGGLLWIANILVFSLWYWEIDGGGPGARHRNGHKAADFMFPQQSNDVKTSWAPHYLDYLFVAFTGATALSPADTYPLTRPAKGLMMLEALVALIILSILVGRAINIL